MTIKVKQHYRNVNGKLVLVHEHEHKGNAAHHAVAPHEKAVDEEFEKLFGGGGDDLSEFASYDLNDGVKHEAPADDQADVDGEFEKLFGEQAVDEEFDKIFNDGEATPEAEAQKSATIEQLMAIGKEWKSDDGKHRIYFNGLAKWNGGGYEGMAKGAKVWIDAKTGEWGSKNVEPETLEKIKSAIKNEAMVNAAASTQEPVAQAEPVANDEPKVGEKVPFTKLKVGMKFKTSLGKEAVVTKVDNDNNEVEVNKKTSAGNGVDLVFSASEWPNIQYFYDEGGEPQHRVDNGPKIGSKPKFDQLEKGMVLSDGYGKKYLILDDETSPLVVQGEDGWIGELKGSTFNAAQSGDSPFTLSGVGEEGFEKQPLAYGLKVGDTKVINGVTYMLNANHRWEKVDGAQAAAEPGIAEKIGALTSYQKTIINGFMIQKSGYSNNIFIAKSDENGKPLPKKVKDALAEMHPSGFKKKKAFYLVDKGDLDKVAEIIGGKAEAKQKPKPTPVAPPKSQLPASFPFKQIGPQKGSNPGGLYEDAFGKKWYIKFPDTESHAKNELLASKLYMMAGVAVPKLKLVKNGDKVGIASAFQEGLTNNGDALKAGAPGAKDGFGVDAWLANWDSAGLSFDNMPVDKDGKAVRIDVGGSLLYRAQGGLKGEAFGTTVTEVDTLRDPKMNPQTAAVFGSMSDAEINASIVGVLVIPDDAIKAAVEKWGPGDATAKKQLAEKLIARKQYLGKRFPEAYAIANPPAPDPRALPIDETKLPPKIDFHNYNGTGKGLSGKEWKNAANQKTFDELYRYAMKGDLIGMKNYQYKVINPDTGEETGATAFITDGHPNKDISKFYSEACAYMEAVAYPSNKKVEGWLPEDVEDVAALSESFPSHPFGTTVGDVSHEKRLGFWISLGEVSEPEIFVPKDVKEVSMELKNKGKADYGKMPQELKSWLGNVQGSGSSNIGDKKSANMAHQKKVVAMAYQHATEFPEGTRLRRWMNMSPDMKALLSTAKPGHVFQNPRSMCCSMNPEWETKGTHFGSVMLEIVYAKGAKGLAAYGSGGFYKLDNSSSDEQEITSLPGQRYMLLEAGKAKNGKPKYKVLCLPPDPTYMADLGIVDQAAVA